MPVDDRMRAQARLILDGHPSAATHPAADQWDDADNIEYFYRTNAILVREPDVARVVAALGVIFDDVGYGDVPEGEQEIQVEPVTSGLVRLTVPGVPTGVPDLVALLDDAVGPGVAKPEHKIYVCPFSCPARRPAWTLVAGAASPGPETTGKAFPSSLSTRG
jgi:hypothetical protein